MDGADRCTRCLTMDLIDDQRFCHVCGDKLEPAPFCHECKTKLFFRAQTKCHDCGDCLTCQRLEITAGVEYENPEQRPVVPIPHAGIGVM